MKRILLATYGSYGDLHPFLGLARALRSLGHAVTLATHPHYELAARRQGIRFVAIPPALSDLGPESQWAELVLHPTRGPEFILRQGLIPYLEAAYRILLRETPGHDLVLTHTMAFAAVTAADKLKIPRLSVVLQPSLFFSAYDPPVLSVAPHFHHLAKLGPRLYRALLARASRHTLAWIEPVQALRQREGLPRLSENPLFSGQYSPLGTLALFPAALARPQPDWPPHTEPIGFPFFDEEGSSNLSPGTAEFLEAGTPPIVFTLGSAVVAARTPFYAVALAAIERIAGRAIFLHGRNPDVIPQAARRHPAVHVAEYEPFSRLFPRAAVNVHQCGIGTTAQALRAARPQVLVPFAFDQPDNALRVRRLGCGRIVTSRRLNVRRLAHAIEIVRADARYAGAAAQVAPRFESDFTENLRRALHSRLGW